MGSFHMGGFQFDDVGGAEADVNPGQRNENSLISVFIVYGIYKVADKIIKLVVTRKLNQTSHGDSQMALQHNLVFRVEDHFRTTKA